MRLIFPSALFGLMKLLSQVVLLLATVAAVIAAVILVVRDSGSGRPIEISMPEDAPGQPAVPRVYVTGAVNNPGVYPVEPGARLSDAIAAAGGATSDADLDAVNLALRLRDEQHWHIPGRVVEARTSQAQSQGSPTGGAAASGKIDLNSAGAKTLEGLPQIGQIRAQLIVQYRQSNGPFVRVDDLLAISGIGPATLDAIRDLVEVR